MDQTAIQLEQEVCHAEIYSALVLDLMERVRCGLRAPHHGLGLVMGYDENLHNKYLYENNDDIFTGSNVNISDKAALDAVLSAVEIDGLILADKAGSLRHTGYYVDVSPFNALEEMGVPNHRPLWQRFGFSREVGTRHLNAIAGSHFMPDTHIYVISGENNSLRSFNNGRIVYSTSEQKEPFSHYLQ